MSHWLILPDGNAVTSSVLKSVSLHDRGVACRDAQNKIVVWVRVPNDVVGKLVRDKLIAFARDGTATQPDWTEIFAAGATSSTHTASS